MNDLHEVGPEIVVSKIIPAAEVKDTAIIELSEEEAFRSKRGHTLRVEYKDKPEEDFSFGVRDSKETGTLHPARNNSELSALTIGTGTAWALMTLNHSGLKGISNAGNGHFFSVENGRVGLWENSGFPRAVNFEKLPGELADFHHEPGSESMAVILTDGRIVVFTIQAKDRTKSMKACTYTPEDLQAAA